MPAILKSPLAGIAGRVSRPGLFEVVEGRVVSATNTPTLYGQAVILDANGQAALPVSGSTSVYGVIVQTVPTQQTTGGMSAGFGPATPQANVADNILRSGYVSVAIPSGDTAPVAGGAVFVQKIVNGAVAVGTFRTAADGSNTIAVTNAVFSSNGVTGSGVAEVQFNV